MQPKRCGGINRFLKCQASRLTEISLKTNDTMKITAIKYIVFLSFAVCIAACDKVDDLTKIPLESIEDVSINSNEIIVEVERDIQMGDYFDFMEKLVDTLNSTLPYTLTEHLLVHANSHIIDRLAATDYYTTKAKNQFIYDPSKIVILEKGEHIRIPAHREIQELIRNQTNTYIDINIPEYTLQIVQYDREIARFPVRVGQNKVRYWEVTKREEDLRTKHGEGYISWINKNPIYMNPVDAHTYTSTLRDDGQRTLLPQIPFLHPTINGHEYGQAIHPTTNPTTLGKAYSNGCVGVKEADAWRIYYHAPVGTKVKIRYDLIVCDEKGKTSILPDIYEYEIYTGSCATYINVD